MKVMAKKKPHYKLLKSHVVISAEAKVQLVKVADHYGRNFGRQVEILIEGAYARMRANQSRLQ